MRIVYISVQSMDARNMEAPVRAVADENGWDLEIHCYNADEVDNDPLVYHEMVRQTNIADLILMKIFRTKQIEELEGNTLVSEGPVANYQDMLNYAVFALIKLTIEA